MPGARIRVPLIVWAALLVSQGVYVGLIVSGVVERAPVAPDAVTIGAITVAAIASAVASFVVPAVVRRSAIARGRWELREVPDPTAPVGFRGAAPTIREYVDPEAIRARAIAAGFPALIIALALSETVSVMGFVLAMLGAAAPVWAPFFAAGLSLTALRVPTARTFYAPIERATGVPIPR